MLVAIAAIVFGILVAGNAATGQGSFAPLWSYCFIAAFVLIAFVTFDPRWWSLHIVYRDRLRDAFSTTRSDTVARNDAIKRSSERTAAEPDGGPPRKVVRLFPLPGGQEPTLDKYDEAPGPELLICCSAG